MLLIVIRTSLLNIQKAIKVSALLIVIKAVKTFIEWGRGEGVDGVID